MDNKLTIVLYIIINILYTVCPLKRFFRQAQKQMPYVSITFENKDENVHRYAVRWIKIYISINFTDTKSDMRFPQKMALQIPKNA